MNTSNSNVGNTNAYLEQIRSELKAEAVQVHVKNRNKFVFGLVIGAIGAVVIFVVSNSFF